MALKGKKKKPKEDLNAKKCVTPTFRVAFPKVFKPESFKNGQGEKKYSLVMLFDKKTKLKTPAAGQKNSIMDIIQNACVMEWGDDEDDWPEITKPLIGDGDKKSDLEGYKGCWYIPANSKNKPGLVDEDVNPILDQDDFYAGCYARAEVIAVAYDEGASVGVKLALMNIQKVRDGKPFTGGSDPSMVFTAIEREDDDEDEETEDDDEETPPPKKKKKAKVVEPEPEDDDEDDDEDDTPPPPKKKKKKSSF